MRLDLYKFFFISAWNDKIKKMILRANDFFTNLKRQVQSDEGSMNNQNSESDHLT